MARGGHLCSSPLTAASLDDTPGEQMCSNEFTENSDVTETAFHYFPVILLGSKSSAVQQEVQSAGTNNFKDLV